MNNEEKAYTAGGAAVGAFGSFATCATALSSAGVTGMSAAGLTSGLAAIGGTMVGGIAVFAAAPVVGLALGGYGGYKICQSLRKRKKRNK